MTHRELQEDVSHFLKTITLERNVSNHTLRAYQSDLEHFALFWQNLVVRDPLGIKAAIERYVAFLYHKKIAKSSIARKLSCFTSFERYLKRAKGIELDLVLPRPRIIKKAPTVLSLDDIFFLLDKVQLTDQDTQFPHRDKAIIELLYATGICCSELVNIQLKDLDHLAQTITIVSKRKKERVVSFGTECKRKLDVYITYERSKPVCDREYLFLNYKQEQLTTRSIQRICNLFSTFLGAKKSITPHVLRHSYAAHLLQQGIDIKQVQQLLGHTTITTTEKYAQLLNR